MLKDPTWDRDFEPPHCPTPNCIYEKAFHGKRPYIRKGHYQRKTVPKSVQRFQCTACRRNFSTQTFSVSYWQKRPDLTQRIFLCAVGCMGIRQMARLFAVCPETICRHIARLGRHCMLFHLSTWKLSPPSGPVVFDGFRSFEHSQYRPFEHQLSVEADTDFWIYHVDTELRRSGRMTKWQKRRRAELERQNGRPARRAHQRDIDELLRTSLQGTARALLRSDEQLDYPRVISKLEQSIQHEVTHSKLPRTAQNPLFPVNLLDLILRHSQANHKRETIAFSKRRQASAERAMILLVWRNYIKSHREKKPGATPAMLKGLTKCPLKVNDILRWRLFPRHHPLMGRWQEYYDRRIKTREIERNREHTLKFAY